MKKLQNLFATPKKAILSSLCAVAVLALVGAGTACTSSTTAQAASGGQVDLEGAKKIALDDAGVKESEVTFAKTRQDREDGIDVFDIEFYVGNVEYEYEINASTGAVYSKSQETHAQQNPAAAGGAASEGQIAAAGVDLSAESAGGVSLEEAKNAALADAGLTADQVTFTKTKLDYDDGVEEYEIEFLTDTSEYDYTILAADGSVRERSSEALARPAQDSASGNTYIGVDTAKETALAHAGLTEAEISFSKAKLENDDGIAVYEVEFYKDRMEYEYEIDAVTGQILEYDSEWDD